MRALDPALKAHLESGATTLCDCWRLVRRDGRLFGFTDHDAPLSFEGTVFEPEGAVEASATETAAGLAPGGGEIVGALSSSRISERDVALGRFDGAELTRWRVNWAAPEQRVVTFSGTIGAITTGENIFRAELVGPAASLNRPTGRAYLKTCDAALGDNRCKVDITSPTLRGVGRVISAWSGGVIVSGLETFAPGWFARGALTWSGGENDGFVSVVASDRFEGGSRRLDLWGAPPAAVNEQDAFICVAGCDKSFETCRSKFGAALNFRGFPHIPGEDWILAGAAADGVRDGGSRNG